MSAVAGCIRIRFRQLCCGSFAALLLFALGAAPVAPARAQVEGSTALQSQLRATDEEWSILLPKLVHIAALRDEVDATAGGSTDGRPAFMRQIFDSPLGGTSMDVPVMPNSGIRNVVTALGLIGRPFDPSKAPGAGKETVDNGKRAARGFGDRMRTGGGNSVQTLLNDLKTLLDNKETTDAQLRDKLAEVRANRATAVRDLAAAEADVLPLLTTDQTVVLVNLGYLD
jgi:hypothetical protein